MTYPAHGEQVLFLVISGPSGAGKSTLIREFLRRQPGFVKCLSVTTRSPRGDEKDGVDYRFVSQEKFEQMVHDGEFLEHAWVYGQRYGTPRSFVADCLVAGTSVIKDVDVQGAVHIRRSFPAAVQIFVVPPTHEEIERRLRSRGTDSEDNIRRRLSEARLELAQWAEYDYLVYNGDLAVAAEDLAAVVRAEQMRAPGRKRL